MKKHRSNICSKFHLHSSIQLVSFSLAQGFSNEPAPFKPLPFVSFTLREIDVLVCLKLALTSKEMARRLNISHRTLEKHVQNIKAKAGLRTLYDLRKLADQVAHDQIMHE